MYHIATHNIGLGSYNDDFNRLMKDLLMKDHFVKVFFTLGKTIVFNVKRVVNHQKLFKAKARPSPIKNKINWNKGQNN